MTREDAKILAPVLQAFADGKAVQYKGHHESNWKDAPEHEIGLFDAYDWRVKPQEPRSIWIHEPCFGSIGYTEEQARERIKNGEPIAHFKEVL